MVFRNQTHRDRNIFDFDEESRGIYEQLRHVRRFL